MHKYIRIQPTAGLHGLTTDYRKAGSLECLYDGRIDKTIKIHRIMANTIPLTELISEESKTTNEYNC